MTDLTDEASPEEIMQLREDIQTGRAVLARMSDELPCPHTKQELLEIRQAAIEAICGSDVRAAKLGYETPTVERLGTIEELTKAGRGGGMTDASFTAGTPVDDITMS